MKKLYIALIILFASAPSVYANNPEETLRELARIGHNASPTPGLEDQVTSWYSDVQHVDSNALFQAFIFAQHILPSLFSARDNEMYTEVNESGHAKQEIPSLRRAWIRSLTTLLDELIAHLSTISIWGHACTLDQLNTLGLQELDAWIEQFKMRQRVFHLDYNRCVTPHTPGLGTRSAPNTSPEQSPEPLPTPRKIWDQARPLS